MMGNSKSSGVKHERSAVKIKSAKHSKMHHLKPNMSWRHKLVIEYWFRMSIKGSMISISDIITIMLEYAPTFELLTFNNQWMSKRDDEPAFTLKYNNTMAAKAIKDCQGWILADVEPVKEGKICWRLNV